MSEESIVGVVDGDGPDHLGSAPGGDVEIHLFDGERHESRSECNHGAVGKHDLGDDVIGDHAPRPAAIPLSAAWPGSRARSRPRSVDETGKGGPVAQESVDPGNGLLRGRPVCRESHHHNRDADSGRNECGEPNAECHDSRTT